ncbi:MAG: hypothetical protein PHW47_10260 [Lachnospira sp.]|nr:hypothetical protein [Lachnospira sp.]
MKILNCLKNYFGYHGVKRQLSEYGHIYTRGRYVVSMVFLAIVILSGGMLLQLKMECTLVVFVTALCCFPEILRTHFYNMFQEKRYRDVDGYLHQMIYSFQRLPKISIALRDTHKITDGKMKIQVQEAMDELQYGSGQWVYSDALRHIETHYSCERIGTLHRFMIQVEERGGRYHNSMRVFLEDVDRWGKRIYQLQKEMKCVKRDISIGILISIFLSSASILISWILKYTSGMNISIANEPLYQLISTVFFVISILFYTYTQVHHKRNWLQEARLERQISYDLKVLKKCQKTKRRHQGFRGKAVQKRLEEDLYHGFSEWLRNIALNLQEKPLQEAVKESYGNCPIVMKESLENFINAIELDPSDVTPYYNFLGEFQVPDISASVRTLYGLSELDHTNMDEEINKMIARNYEMQDRHETLKGTDYLSMMKFSEYIPVFFVSLKMGLDMILLISNYL